MRQIRIVTRCAVAAMLATAALMPSSASAESPSMRGVDVSAAVRHDTSPRLDHLIPTAPSAANLRERPLRLIGSGGSPNQPDGAVQQTAGSAAATTAGLGFPGVGKGDYGFSPAYAPPDTVGAVGETQYVQWVNVNFAVFDKSNGALMYGPAAGNTLWSGFGTACQTENAGDPIVQYDKSAKRWIFTQFTSAATPYLQCVAVSTTSDALGTYNRYAFSYGTVFPDYPKLGVWPDGYYITFNMFTSTFQGAKVCAYDRAKMLAGTSATQQCFQLSVFYGGLLPGDVDGTNPPPAGAPNPILNFGTNSLNLWRFHVDWANTANTSLSGPISIPVASFSRACNGSNCVPQPNTTQMLDSLADRLMYRLAYRHFADGHESLVVNHSVNVGTGVSSVRWYELRNAPGSTLGTATPVVYQQSTLDGSDGIHRWMGSAAMDQAGDIAVGYSASSASVYPSVRYTGRVVTDPLNTMQTETIVMPGTGSQLQNLSRWGDYSAMTVDPVDDCTFWYTNEYLKTNGTWNWSTWITSFKFPNCGAAPTPDFTISATPSSRTVTAGTPATATYTVTVTPTGAPVTVTLSASGQPSDSTAAFSPNPTSGASTLSVTTTSATSAATYTITITGSLSGGPTHTTSVTLVVNPASTATVPGTPNAPTVAPANGKGVNVSWSAPTNTGGSSITGYRLYRGASPASMTPLITLGNVTGYKDTTTIRRVTYYYAVSAVNAIGVGSPSSAGGPVVAK